MQGFSNYKVKIRLPPYRHWGLYANYSANKALHAKLWSTPNIKSCNKEFYNLKIVNLERCGTRVSFGSN